MSIPYWNWARGLPKPEYYLVIIFSIGLGVSFLALIFGIFIQKTAKAPAFGGNLTIGFAGTPHYLNPILAPANEVDRILVKILYPSLLRYDQNGKLIPYLAERFEIGDNGKVYDFFLKKGALWDDGKAITANDIAFTVKTIQDPKISSPLSRIWEGVKIEVMNDATVRFTLQEPYAFFLQNATLEILPQHIWKEVSAENFPLSEYNKKPVGAGPYSFSNFAKSDNAITSIDFETNKTFFGDPPYIQKIIARFYSQNEDLFTAYKQKEIDLFGLSFSSELSRIKFAEPHITQFPLPRYFAIFLNEKKNPALAEKKVREALLRAIDRNTIISSLLNNRARKVHSPIPPVLSEYYENDLPDYEFDGAKAENLLRQAGISEKKHLAVELTIINNNSLMEIGRAVKANWEKIGVSVTLRTVELSQLRDQVLQKRSFEAFLFGQALALQPDPFSLWHSSQSEYPGLNLSSYKNPDVDAVLEKLRKNLDKDAQKELFKKFQSMVAKDIPVLFLYSPDYLVISNSSVKGIASMPLSSPEDYISQLPNWYVYTKRASK